MPLSDRDYIRGKHPPYCNCVYCVNNRLGIVTRKIKKQYPNNQDYITTVQYQYPSHKSSSPKKEYSGCVKFLSCSFILVVVLLIVGVVGGGIWGIAKYHGNIGEGIASAYNWVADGVITAKDNIGNWFSSISENTPPISTGTSTAVPTTQTVGSIVKTPTPSKTTGIDPETGTYKNYYLGLVDTSGGVITGEDCYGAFIVLINNKDAHDPTYSELVNFLKSDTTDKFPYQMSISSLGFYYGKAEDQIDLRHIQDIIDGISQPKNPKICADFAERLHNNAEMAGIRCGYVSLDSPNHALNVFQTTDKGLLFIDDTGNLYYGPSNCDKTVVLDEGSQYVPVSLFSEPGWSDTWDSLGAIHGIFVTWDGEWRD
jgi:hypothetical protein